MNVTRKELPMNVYATPTSKGDRASKNWLIENGPRFRLVEQRREGLLLETPNHRESRWVPVGWVNTAAV